MQVVMQHSTTLMSQVTPQAVGGWGHKRLLHLTEMTPWLVDKLWYWGEPEVHWFVIVDGLTIWLILRMRVQCIPGYLFSTLMQLAENMCTRLVYKSQKVYTVASGTLHWSIPLVQSTLTLVANVQWCTWSQPPHTTYLKVCLGICMIFECKLENYPLSW